MTPITLFMHKVDITTPALPCRRFGCTPAFLVETLSRSKNARKSGLTTTLAVFFDPDKVSTRGAGIGIIGIIDKGEGEGEGGVHLG